MNQGGSNAAVSDGSKRIRRLSGQARREQILKVAEEQFAAAGFVSTKTAGIAEMAGISEATVYVHFETKRKLFEEVVDRNSRARLEALREWVSKIPKLPLFDFIESLAESTVLSCVEGSGNASVMIWALMEAPQYAADLYRAEIGAIEALWDVEIENHVEDPLLRRRIAVHMVPYSVHACMAFGLWLAALHHKPETARAHARQYSDAVVQVARGLVSSSTEILAMPLPQLARRSELSD